MTCGFATPATRTRCHYCWNRIDPAAPILERELALDMLQRQEVFLAERAAAQRARRRRRLIVLGAVGGLLLVWFGWWVYRSFIYTPPPVPQASNPALAMLTGDDVWATSGGDARGSRSTGASVPLDGAEAWSTSVGRAATTSLVADRERVYVVTDERLTALSIADGSVAWEFRLQGAPYGAPTLAGDRVYLALRAGQLLALEAATGEVVWYSLNSGTRFGTSPIVADGYAYVFGMGDLVAFDAETGEVVWRTENRANLAFTNPALTEGYIAGVAGDEVLLFSLENGAQTYFYEFTRAFPYSSVAAGDRFFVTSRRWTVAFDETSGRPWWEYWRAAWNQFWLWGIAPGVPAPEHAWQNNDPPMAEGHAAAIIDDLLILASRDGEVQALRTADGVEAWRLPPGSPDAIPTGPLATSDGLLIAHRDRIVLYDPRDGSVIAERPIEAGNLSDVIVTSTGMYLLYTDGTVTAVR